MGVSILREVNSIIQYYSQLRADDFGPNGNLIARIGAPLAGPPAHIRVHHAKMALSALMQAIQNPPDNYPILNSLKSGSYICTMNQQWANVGIDVVLFK